MCSELLQESESAGRQQEQRQSPEETGMCVCEGGRGVGGCGSMWMCIHVCMCVGRWVLSPVKKLVSVCVEGWGGLNVHAFGYV